MADKKQIGAVLAAFLLSFMSFYGYTELKPGDLDNVYICDVNGVVDEFARLSGTKYTAYPNEENNVGQSRCTDGIAKGSWERVEDYASREGIDLYSLVSQDPDGVPAPATYPTPQYICGDVCKVK